jgi:hypothetical protein
MNAQLPRTFFTPLKDCVLWSGKLLSVIVLAAAAVGWVTRLIRHQPIVNLAGSLGQMLAFVVGAAVVVGLLVFFFGWLGRVTISKEGVEAPRYSGTQEYLRWGEIERAEPGSLSGWPCTLIFGHSGKGPLYLMVLGREKVDMIACILETAGAENPLTKYYSASGA